MAATILIIEDEPDLVDILAFNLEKEGFLTRTALSGEAGVDGALQEPAPDLVLLDLMLPDMPGTEVCRRLRLQPATKNIPVIILTARGAEVDRVVGFEVGADDYVTKPFSVRELILRIRAVLRRQQKQSDLKTEEIEHYGCLKVHSQGHRVWVDETQIKLTALEFRLLTTLLERAGRVQTRDTLLADVWGMQSGLTTRTVDTHVTRLRKKLGRGGEYIETMRGVGYRFLDRSELSK